jgi:hypothetical protein
MQVGPASTSRRFVATVQEKVLQGLITTNEPRVEGWCVDVRPEHVGDQAESVYDAAFASVGSWIISHHMEALPGGRGLGLPEAVIDLMCRHLAHPIHSSAHANYRLASGMQMNIGMRRELVCGAGSSRVGLPPTIRVQIAFSTPVRLCSRDKTLSLAIC